ncbi:MAG: branched-chain amino acid transport system substrate-binding protein [Actinomycetota bacterium]|nr:branched-chain amino acid transport system substrate-binding protein [Actinomycetota bacterium]
MTHPRRRSAAIALVAVLAAACSGHSGPDASRTTTISGASATGPSGDRVTVKIAVFQDLSIGDSSQLAVPSYLGLQLALTEGMSEIPVVPQLVALDVQGDPARAADLARQVADDPAYVAAVIAPFWAETNGVGDILNAAHIPTLSLSALSPDIPSYGWTTWRRLVPTQPRQADSLASLLAGSANSLTGVCLVRDDTSYSVALTGLLKQRLRDLVKRVVTVSSDAAVGDPFGQAIADIDAAHCRTIAWTGFAPDGAILRTTLTDSGLPGVAMFAADAVKDEPFLTQTAGAGNDTVVTCPCADLATSTDPAAQRFVHDYQSQFGASPGVYAAEGWDLGTILLTAFRAGVTGRAAMVGAIADIRRLVGLAGIYEWTDGGELVPSVIQVRASVDRGQRWTPLATTAVPSSLPLHTEGLLTAAACRAGLPFDDQVRGRPAGFDVDLATAVAKNLGVRLGWEDVPCDKARAQLASGRLDMLFAERDALPQGTPTSRVALSVRTALVAARRAPTVTDLGALGPGDRVGVVSGPVTTPWVRQVLAGPGAKIRRYRTGAAAYDALVRGDVAAVVDTEYGAWAGIERRSRLQVTQTFDAGAHDVLITSAPTGTALLGAVDGALGHLLQTGRYALLWAKWFPGSTVPSEVGT